MYLGIAVSSLVAAIASVMEISIRRDKGLYRNAVPLCALYVAFDVAATLILLIFLRAGSGLLKENANIAAAVVAGLVAPLLMRTKVPVPFTKGRQVVNAVAMLRRLQVRVSAEIDDRCAAGETAWILDEVLPAIKALPLHDVEEWVIESINVKYRGAEEALASRHRFLDEVRRLDAGSSVDERKHLMIQVLIDRCGRRQVIALVKRAKRLTESPVGQLSVTNPAQIQNMRPQSAALNPGEGEPPNGQEGKASTETGNAGKEPASDPE